MDKKLYITKAHVAVEIISYVVMLASFVLCIYAMKTLPDEIPTHYDLQGNVDGYGSPGSIIILPVIMLISNMTISLLMHFLSPSFYSMPFKIKPGRELRQYKDVIWMLVIMELMFSLFTFVCTWSQYTCNGKIMFPASMIFMAALFAEIIIIIIVMYRHNK